MLSGLSLSYFAGAYIVALVLEASRLLSRSRPQRLLLMVGMAVVGLALHSIYLFRLAQSQMATGGGLLAGWYEWCLVAGWLLAAAYVGLTLRRPENTVGVFLLPLVLLLILAALGFRQLAPSPFSRSEAVGAWRVIHGAAQLLGTAGVLMGLAAGVMYLVQAYRLKKALPPSPGLRLPSLEWLRKLNHEMLFVSLICCTAGMLSGIVLNANQNYVVAWTDPVVWSSAVLVTWLIVAVVFERVYRPVRQGHKVAYLTLASAVFLALALTLVMIGQHGAKPREFNSQAWPEPAAQTRELRP